MTAGKASTGLTFTAAFAPNRRCLTADADGEIAITLVIPESDSPKMFAAFSLLRDQSFRVTIHAEGQE